MLIFRSLEYIAAKIPKRTAEHCDEDVMSSSKIKKTGSRKNFWTPLQLIDDDCDNGAEMNIDNDHQSKNKSVSPIKVLTQNKEYIIELINKAGISSYLTKKISLGLKIICETTDIYDKIVSVLRSNKCQFFTHDHKNNKPFKVVLRGLDYKTDVDVKNELVNLGLKCIDVKCVKKTYDHYVDTIYIVHFENGSIKLHDLKKKVRALFRTIVTWDYHRKIKNQPVQCHRCQMFGHGERGCNVIVRCANCAQKHKTIDCTADKIQRANCGERHKATDLKCSNRSKYIEIMQKISRKNSFSPQQIKGVNPLDNVNTFPALNNRRFSSTINQQTSMINFRHSNHPTSQSNLNTGSWYSNINNNNTFNNARDSAHNNNISHSLFSEEEFMTLTMEMISKLSSCKTREEQFGVITQLAFKFVYCNVK